MVNWKHIASYLALLNSPVPSKPQVDDYQRELPPSHAARPHAPRLLRLHPSECSQLTPSQTRAWFDESESAVAVDKAYPFPRLEQVKELLFEINAKDAQVEIAAVVGAFRVPQLEARKQEKFAALFEK